MQLIKIPEQFSDCRMFCYRLMLSYHGIEVMEHELFGIGEGLEFKLVNVSPMETKLYCPLGRKLNLEQHYSKKMGIKLYSGQFHKEDGKSANINIVKRILEKHGPVVVNIDRYYLDYLECDKAHMGYHAILISNYNDDSCTFDVYDALSKNIPTSLDYDTFLNGIFSESVLSTNTEYYYCSESIELKRVDRRLIEDSLSNIAEEMSNISIPKIIKYLDQVDALRKSHSCDWRMMSYLKMQCKLFQNSFVEQETSHMFYRDLFFRFIEEYWESTKLRNIKDENIHQSLILNDIYKEYTNGNAEHIFENIRKLLQIEERIFKMISKKEFI